MNTSHKILSAVKLNDHLELSNRIVMAPMTRSKATEAFVPTQAMADYYARRADAGLIITEGTIIRRDGLGYPTVPGIYTQQQIDGWNNVTDAVHQRGGKIFMQLWHVGRVSHPHYLNGELPISPSATEMSNRIPRSNGLNYGKSRALEIAEIKQLIEDFKQAAINAMQAGFDGVEIHGANGYLIDQFLHHSSNHRDDEYGGSAENMARFAIEIVTAISDEIGSHKVGIRLSPGAYLNEIVGDQRDAEVFQYLLQKFNNLNIAYVHTGNFDDSVTFPELNNQSMTQFMRNYYRGNLIASGSYNFDSAKSGIDNQLFDLVAFGRPFIANPNLVDRFRQQEALQEYDAEMLAELI